MRGTLMKVLIHFIYFYHTVSTGRELPPSCYAEVEHVYAINSFHGNPYNWRKLLRDLKTYILLELLVS